MKHSITLIITLAVSLSTFAQAVGRFTFQGKEQMFWVDDKRQLTISTNCKKLPLRPGKPLHYDCEAYRALAKVNLADLKESIAEGANAGAVLCQEVLKQTVVIGQDFNQNDNSFCKFADGSYLDCGTLYHYAQLNRDKKRRK